MSERVGRSGSRAVAGRHHLLAEASQNVVGRTVYCRMDADAIAARRALLSELVQHGQRQFRPVTSCPGKTNAAGRGQNGNSSIDGRGAVSANPAPTSSDIFCGASVECTPKACVQEPLGDDPGAFGTNATLPHSRGNSVGSVFEPEAGHLRADTTQMARGGDFSDGKPMGCGEVSPCPPTSRPLSLDAQKSGSGPLQFHASFECGNLLSARLVRWSIHRPAPSASVDDEALVVAPNAAAPGPVGIGTASQAGAPGRAAGGGGVSEEVDEPELEYELHLDTDTQSAAGHTQWFFFGVDTLNFTGMVHFQIVNMQKLKSLYQHGLRPHVHSQLSRDRGWEPFACENVSYTPNASSGRVGNSGDVAPDRSTLSFSYRVERAGDKLFFASYPPYTYTMLGKFIQHLADDRGASHHFQCVELCRSIGQLSVPLLVISQNISSEARFLEESGVSETTAQKGPSPTRDGDSGKPAVAIIARQHPGEVVGSWAVQGLLRFLLGPTPAARKLREQYLFHVVPMVNVDGVVHGNSRCNLAGVDPNRVWADPNPIIHPEVCAIKGHLQCLAEGVPSAAGAGRPSSGLELFLDLHGHSVEFGCFFYGSCSTSQISAALFPKLCALASRDVSFERCHWRCPKGHRGTARYVVHKQLGVKDSFTMECSFFAPANVAAVWRAIAADGPVVWGRSLPAVRAETFSPMRVEWIGCAVGCAIAVFMRRCGCLGVSGNDSVLANHVVGSFAREDRGLVDDAEAGERCDGRAQEDCLDRPLQDQQQLGELHGAIQEHDVCIQPVLWGDVMLGTPLLLDVSLAVAQAARAARPWFTAHQLETISVDQVLEGLIASYGHRVPDPRKALADDGGSDGDYNPMLDAVPLRCAVDGASPARARGASAGATNGPRLRGRSDSSKEPATQSSKCGSLSSSNSQRKTGRDCSRGQGDNHTAQLSAVAPLPAPIPACSAAPQGKLSPRTAAQRWLDSDDTMEALTGNISFPPPWSRECLKAVRPRGIPQPMLAAPNTPLPPPLPPENTRQVHLASSLAASRFTHSLAGSRCGARPMPTPRGTSCEPEPVGASSIYVRRGCGVPEKSTGDVQWSCPRSVSFDGAVVGKCVDGGSGEHPSSQRQRSRGPQCVNQLSASAAPVKVHHPVSAREARDKLAPPRSKRPPLSARHASRGPPVLPAAAMSQPATATRWPFEHASPRAIASDDRQILPNLGSGMAAAVENSHGLQRSGNFATGRGAGRGVTGASCSPSRSAVAAAASGISIRPSPVDDGGGQIHIEPLPGVCNHSCSDRSS